MALEWPEETKPRRRRPRQNGYQPLNPLSPTRELFEPDPSEPKRRFRYWLPTLVVIVLLILVGVVLAMGGPLPTVFPRIGSL